MYIRINLLLLLALFFNILFLIFNFFYFCFIMDFQAALNTEKIKANKGNLQLVKVYRKKF